jgi:hypothetical protein
MMKGIVTKFDSLILSAVFFMMVGDPEKRGRKRSEEGVEGFWRSPSLYVSRASKYIGRFARRESSILSLCPVPDQAMSKFVEHLKGYVNESPKNVKHRTEINVLNPDGEWFALWVER